MVIYSVFRYVIYARLSIRSLEFLHFHFLIIILKLFRTLCWISKQGCYTKKLQNNAYYLLLILKFNSFCDNTTLPINLQLRCFEQETILRRIMWKTWHPLLFIKPIYRTRLKESSQGKDVVAPTISNNKFLLIKVFISRTTYLANKAEPLKGAELHSISPDYSQMNRTSAELAALQLIKCQLFRSFEFLVMSKFPN